MRVVVQSQRDPVTFAFGPWSEFVHVSGITTRPDLGVPTPPMQGSVQDIPSDLLIFVGVPVGVVLVVGAVVVVVVVVCCCWYRKK